MALLYETDPLFDTEVLIFDPAEHFDMPGNQTADSDEVLIVRESLYNRVCCPGFGSPANDGEPWGVKCRLNFFMKLLPNQERKSARRKEWHVVGGTAELRTEHSFFYLDILDQDEEKVALFIHSVLHATP